MAMDRSDAWTRLRALWSRGNSVVGALMRPLWTRPSQQTPATASVQAANPASTLEIKPKLVVLGHPGELPGAGADTAHLTILNHPAPSDGEVESVRIRLGGRPPGDGARWEVRVYEREGGGSGSTFALVAKRAVRLSSHVHRGEQTIALGGGGDHAPHGENVGLPICKGQFVGLCNRDGRLNLTYTEPVMISAAHFSLAVARAAFHSYGLDFHSRLFLLCDYHGRSDLDRFQPNPRDERVPYLWYQERVPPPHALGSRTEALRTWFGRAGWSCSMRLQPPEPPVAVPPPTLSSDLAALVNDRGTADVAFFLDVVDRPQAAVEAEDSANAAAAMRPPPTHCPPGPPLPFRPCAPSSSAAQDAVSGAGSGGSAVHLGRDVDPSRCVFAHRGLLAAGAPYFRHLLGGPFSEASERADNIGRARRVRLGGVSRAALLRVVTFLYSGQLPQVEAGRGGATPVRNPQEAAELLVVANKYRLDALLACNCGTRQEQDRSVSHHTFLS